MNSRLSLQLKVLVFVQSVFALSLAAPNVATAAVNIKSTNYPVPSNAYFVAPDGKDSNSGRSYNSPWSVAKALKSAPSGATIVFKGGTYRNVKGSINKKLTLQAYPNEKPLLKGSIEVTGWVAEGGKWRKDGWNYGFPNNLIRKYIDPKKNPMAGHRDMVYINGEALKQVGSKSNVGPGKFYVDYANNKLYIGSNPAGKTVEATALAEGFKIWQNNSSKPSGTVIRGLGFAHFADRGLTIGASNITLENNTFVWNGANGVTFSGSSGSIVRGNIFSYNGRNGLWGGNIRGILIERNTISYNNVERFSMIWDAAGAKFIRTHGLNFRNNTLENNFSNGFWADMSTYNSTITSNTSRNNEMMGIFLELSHKASIAGNVSTNNGVGIMIADTSNAQVYNNTFGNNRHKPTIIKDGPRVNKNKAEVALGIRWITLNNSIYNNSLF